MDGDDLQAGPDVERWQAVAELFTGVSHPIRVAILESVDSAEDRPLTDVADEFDVSRSAVQKHVNRLEESDLVYRPEDTDAAYALTPLGRFFALFLAREGRGLYAAVREVEEAEQEARDEFKDVPLDDSSMEKAVTNRKWELVDEELEEILELLLPEWSDVSIEDVDQE